MRPPAFLLSAELARRWALPETKSWNLGCFVGTVRVRIVVRFSLDAEASPLRFCPVFLRRPTLFPARPNGADGESMPPGFNEVSSRSFLCT